MPGVFCSVQRLLEALDQQKEHIFGGVQAVICDPPYNRLPIAELPISGFSKVCLQYMSHFVELLSARKGVGSHEPLFFTALHFRTGYNLLANGPEFVVKEELFMKGEEARRQKTTIFEVEADPCTMCDPCGSTTKTSE